MIKFSEFLLESTYMYKKIGVAGKIGIFGIPKEDDKSLEDADFWINQKKLSPNDISSVLVGGNLFDINKGSSTYKKKLSIDKILKIAYTEETSSALVTVELNNQKQATIKIMNNASNKPSDWSLTPDLARNSYSRKGNR